MKKIISLCMLFLLVITAFATFGCDFSSDVEKYETELQSATGKWQMVDDNDTYFTFDGSEDVMTYSYFEDGTLKHSGKFKVFYKGLGEDVSTPLTIALLRENNQIEDWLNCYCENFDNFTQFTIMSEERDLGMINANFYTHIYRISELSCKMATYILEGNSYIQETNNYSGANAFNIPSGTYTLSSGESFTFLMTKPTNNELFQYKNGDVTVEGTIKIASDKKTIYLYIEHDPYSKITNEDKDKYDTTFSTYYPPDFYLYGDFSNANAIVINDLYHHQYSPTTITDATWVFGTYVKQ